MKNIRAEADAVQVHGKRPVDRQHGRRGLLYCQNGHQRKQGGAGTCLSWPCSVVLRARSKRPFVPCREVSLDIVRHASLLRFTRLTRPSVMLSAACRHGASCFSY